jgi:hypothetical protein
MPASLWNTFRQGNRTEYLAQYFLTALGVSTPVPRQEDIGIDFYCALANQNGQRLTFHSPFAVQVGSEGSKEFVYGGISDKGRWKCEELAWLFSQELPLFVCLVDKASLRFEVFSTSPMWLTHYTYGSVAEVVLAPHLRRDPLKEIKEQDDKLAHAGDGFRYRIPLGDAVVALGLNDLMTDELDKARIGLEKAINIEMKNLTYRRLGVHFSQWLLNTKPNDPATEFAIGQFYAWNSQPGKNTTEQLEALLPICIALAHNFKAQGLKEDFHKLKGVLSLVPKGKIPSFAQDNLSELF